VRCDQALLVVRLGLLTPGVIPVRPWRDDTRNFGKFPQNTRVSEGINTVMVRRPGGRLQVCHE